MRKDVTLRLFLCYIFFASEPSSDKIWQRKSSNTKKGQSTFESELQEHARYIIMQLSTALSFQNIFWNVYIVRKKRRWCFKLHGPSAILSSVRVLLFTSPSRLRTVRYSSIYIFIQKKNTIQRYDLSRFQFFSFIQILS